MHLAGVAREHGKHDSQLHWSAAQLSSAYTSGAVTPTQVAESILQYVAHSQQSEPAMNYFIAIDTQAVRTQAAQSTIRSSPLLCLDLSHAAVPDGDLMQLLHRA